ncbi:hypothetical protein FF38_01881 [Lucilia cuprina]|uniref:DUF4806 domain-containing protein n=1 Tax=Lucilia cuprina TaxID=7375 RepID=A0A0L0BQ43_LUCCU|nr:hypothetical protein FF38_01881 [Lucilia cuprina]
MVAPNVVRKGYIRREGEIRLLSSEMSHVREADISQKVLEDFVVFFGSFSINHYKEKDSFCFSKELGPIKVVSLSESEFVCKVFRKTENYFEEPFQSFRGLGILVGSNLSIEAFVIKREDIDFKYLCIPYETNQCVLNKKCYSAVKDDAKDNMSKPEMMAQSKLLMECKVDIKKVETSICRMNGEVKDEIIDEIAAMLPLRTIEVVQEVEGKLLTPEFAQAIKTYLHKVKGASEDVSSVIRGLLTDDLLEKYNWERSMFFKTKDLPISKKA